VNFLISVVVNAFALGLAALLLDGITVEGADTTEEAVTLLIVGLIFGGVNAVVAPIVKLLSLPFIILTLGLLLLVINAFMLMLTGWIADALGVGFTVDGFGTALVGAIIITIASWGLSAVLADD